MSRSGWSASSNTDPALENLPNISRKQQSQSTIEVNAVKAPRKPRPEPQKLTAAAVKREVSALRDPVRARFLQGFFRTRQGEYAEGDRMLGLPVPAQRKIACAFRDLPLDELQTLLASPFHEHRLIALIILVAQHKRAGADRKAELHQFYLGHLSGVNNWDLVDGSAPALVGEHLTGSTASKEKQLRTLIRSKNVWHRRIAVLATFTELRAGRSALTFAIAEELLSDKHELVHRSVGWMLREAGKLSQPDLLSFLRLHYDRLPRTTLRYAIELLDPVDRKLWLREPQ